MFLILVHGSPFDRKKTSSYNYLSNNRRRVNIQNRFGSAVGTVWYTRVAYQWCINITELRQFGSIGIVVTALPVDRKNIYKYNSDSTIFAWYSNQSSRGLAAIQTGGPPRISRWRPGDILLLISIVINLNFISTYNVLLR